MTVSSLGVGTAGWRAESPVPLVEQLRLADAVLRHPVVNVIDTSNNYGAGQSERRVGLALDEAGGVPEGFVISAKADRDMRTGEFTAERMRRSLEESLARLGLDRFPLLFLHDPENISWADATAPHGPLAALVEARERGLIERLGVSGGPTRMLREFLELGEFVAVMTHNRWTLVDRSADELLSYAHERGVGVFNAAPLGGGLLVEHPPRTTRYAYGEAHPALLGAVEQFARIANDAGIALAALALQFSMRDPRIDSTILGLASVEELDTATARVADAIPDDVWDAVEAVTLDASTFQDSLIPWRR
nr:aldo/keto reductase [Microbacterium ulmi]